MEVRAYCFTAGTQVWTPRGAITIEKLSAGTEIYSWDLKSESFVPVTVGRVRTNRAHELLEVTFDNGRALRVTPSHPFYDPLTGEYRKIGSFKIGDDVLFFAPEQKQKKTIKITKIKRIHDVVDVYNLSVTGKDLNFLADGILVHNKADCDPGGSGGC